jgi:hypothetical protein
MLVHPVWITCSYGVHVFTYDPGEIRGKTDEFKHDLEG